MKSLFLFLICLFISYAALADETTNNPSIWRMGVHKLKAAANATIIPTNSLYKAFETDITEYGIYGTGNHFGGGLRGQYWTTTGIGAGLDLSFYNQQLTYTSVSLQARTVLGPVSFGLEAGTGVNLSNVKGVQAQTGFDLTYQTQNHNLFGINFHPRYFGEFQNITGTAGNRFLLGLQQSF